MSPTDGMRSDETKNEQPLLGLESVVPGVRNSGQEGGGRQGAQDLGAQNVAPAQGGRMAGVAAGQGAAAGQGVAVARLALGSVKSIEQRLTVITPQRVRAANAARALPPLPQHTTKRSYGAYIGFALCVLVPVIAASVYYGFIASDEYVAEVRFTVKDAATTTTSTTGILASFTGGMLGSGGGNNNYLVTDFLTSQEAIEELQKRIALIPLYAKPEADWLSRYDTRQPIEKFVSYWQKMVTVHYDQITGIAIAKVRAFTPEDALMIANTMVTLAEELVNRIANRSVNDAVRFARNDVEHAQERLRAVRAQLTEYRNRVGVIDPTVSVAASNATLIQTLRASLAQMETQRTTLARNLDPNAPALVTLKNQIDSTRAQLARTEADVGRGTDGTALSSVVGEFEKLNLEIQFGQTMLTSAMQAYELARANAATQHVYITPYVRPSLPQSPSYPRRFSSILTVGALAFVFWVMGLLIVRSIRERFA